MPIVSSGQMTLVDLNDAKQLVMYVGASQSRTVIFDGSSTYIPNYSSSNQVLTPQLFIAGNGTDVANQSTSTKWYVQVNGAGTPQEITASTTDYTLGTGNPKTLTIKSNILSANSSMTYICELIYFDTGTGLNVITKAEIELVKVSNGRKGEDGIVGSDAFFANVWTPEGNAIKNGTTNIKARADLYKGSSTVVPTTFKWFIQDPTATSSSGGDLDSGNGWRLLNSTYNAGILNYTTTEITIPSTAVTGAESFLCVIGYDGKKYKNVCTIVDLSDPILVRIDGMNIFKNGTGTVNLRATLLRAGSEVDATGSSYTYSWSIYDSNNVKTAFTATGKNIIVDATKIDGKGNIICEVSE